MRYKPPNMKQKHPQILVNDNGVRHGVCNRGETNRARDQLSSLSDGDFFKVKFGWVIGAKGRNNFFFFFFGFKYFAFENTSMTPSID